MSTPFEIDLPNGHWVCRWLDNLRYEKSAVEDEVSVVSRAVYANRKAKPMHVHPTIYNLFTVTVGLCLRVKDNIATSVYGNVQRDEDQGRSPLIVSVSDKSLTDASSEIYKHLGFSFSGYDSALEHDYSFRELMSELHLPDYFGYSYAHLVPNRNADSSLDYFIIPSHELLRYFFLHGSVLSKELLSTFTSPDEQVSFDIKSLVVHPETEPTIYIDDNNKRVAALLVREGLDEEEVNCLARIAFVKQAYKCLEMVKNSLLFNSLDGEDYKFKKLRTVFPQDNPFKLGGSGRRFTWMNKHYILVDQIYDTEEDMNFDQVVYLPITDRRSQKNKSKDKQTKLKNSPKTVSTSSSTLTDKGAGNTDQPAEIDIVSKTPKIFKDNLEPPIKLEKQGQKNTYKTVGNINIPQDIISILEKGKADLKAGRAKLHRKNGYAATAKESIPFFKALGEIRGYQLSYFNLDSIPVKFEEKLHINPCLLSADSPFDVLLCWLKKNNYNIYLVWANNIRYALFYDNRLLEIEKSILETYCNDNFRKNGVYTNEIRSNTTTYDRRNQEYKKYFEIAHKIEKDLDRIISKFKGK